MVTSTLKNINNKYNKMEEQKNKVVEMTPHSAKETEKEKTQKMSYEQLEQVAHQLSEQARQLYSQLQQSNMTNMFKRLDYLFRVLENGSRFDKEFLDKCISEIKDIMTVPESEEEEPKTEE